MAQVVTMTNIRRDGRVVECTGLLNRRSLKGLPGVRIPLSPLAIASNSNVIRRVQTSSRMTENDYNSIRRLAAGLAPRASNTLS